MDNYVKISLTRPSPFVRIIFPIGRINIGLTPTERANIVPFTIVFIQHNKYLEFWLFISYTYFPNPRPPKQN